MRKIISLFALLVAILLVVTGIGVFIINTVDKSGVNMLTTAYLLLTKNLFPLIAIAICCYMLQQKRNVKLAYIVMIIAFVFLVIHSINIFSNDVTTIPLKDNFYYYFNTVAKCSDFETCRPNRETMYTFTRYLEIVVFFSIFLVAALIHDPNNTFTKILRSLAIICIVVCGIYTIATLWIYLDNTKQFIANWKANKMTLHYSFVTLLPIASIVLLILTSITNYSLEDELFDTTKVVSNKEIKQNIFDTTQKPIQDLNKPLTTGPIVEPLKETVHNKEQPVTVIIPMEEEKKKNKLEPLQMNYQQNIPMMSAPVAMSGEVKNIPTTEVKQEIVVAPREEIKNIVETATPIVEKPILSTAPLNVIPVDIVAKPVIKNLPGINENEKDKK